MNKGLEALNKIGSEPIICGNLIGSVHNKYKTQFDTIEKELKALKIIKERLGIRLFETTEDNTLGEIHYCIKIGGVVSYSLKSKEQYDLLKDVLL